MKFYELWGVFLKTRLKSSFNGLSFIPKEITVKEL